MRLLTGNTRGLLQRAHRAKVPGSTLGCAGRHVRWRTRNGWVGEQSHTVEHLLTVFDCILHRAWLPAHHVGNAPRVALWWHLILLGGWGLALAERWARRLTRPTARHLAPCLRRLSISIEGVPQLGLSEDHRGFLRCTHAFSCHSS